MSVKWEEARTALHFIYSRILLVFMGLSRGYAVSYSENTVSYPAIEQFFQFSSFIHPSSLSYDRYKASSKASSLHSAIQSFLLQIRVSSPFLKVTQ
jgi:hypothetical protein